MNMTIESVQLGDNGVASWFAGSYQSGGSNCRGSFQILEINPHPGDDGVTLWCLFNGWGSAVLKDLEVGLCVAKSDAAWETLGLEHATITPKPEKRFEYVGRWCDFADWARARQEQHDERFVSVERLFLLTHWLMMSAHLVGVLASLELPRQAWQQEQGELCEQLGTQATENPYAYSVSRLGSRITPLLAAELPWASELADHHMAAAETDVAA